MKLRLLTKNIIYNTLISVVVLFLGEFSVYLFLKHQINKETEEHLMGERRLVVNKIKNGVPINYFSHNIGDKLYFEKVDKITYKRPLIKDVELVEVEDEEEHEGHWEERFTSKQIIFDVPYQNEFYRFIIEKTIDEDEGLQSKMVLIIVLSGIFMLVLLFVVNYLVYKSLLKPFFKTLTDLKNFNLSERKELKLIQTNTYEFNELNKALELVTKKTIEDYTLLKEFTENASHELQTPLAIINSKIELCLQEGELNEKQAQHLGGALSALDRLSHINQSLILLTKIENNLYEKTESLNISEIILNRLSYFNDFIHNKNLDVKIERKSEIWCVMNRSLCKILLDNLVKNAIKYNTVDGKLIIRMEDSGIQIINSGPAPERPTHEYFQRFVHSNTGDSMGLGLSISKKICDLYKIDISYDYTNDLHRIALKFKQQA